MNFSAIVECMLLLMFLPAISAPNVYTAAQLKGEFGGEHRNALIVHYLKQGYQANEIILLLSLCHGISISLRQLRRLFTTWGLYARRQSPIDSVVTAVQKEMQGRGKFLGYKSMWLRRKPKYGLRVTQSTIHMIQSAIDPEGVESRRANRLNRRMYTCQGPNHILHIDGYDKLKPYGIAIHGAIDGFSRKVVWLHAGPSNNNPRVINKLYIDFVKDLRAVPMVVRSDRGTENVGIRRIQTALRWYHNDAMAREKSFLYGKSTANQRIENWWCTGYWMMFFKGMIEQGLYDNSDRLQVECVRFCFTRLIQDELNMVRQTWNQHRLRAQRNIASPSGKPDLLYYCPELYNALDCKRRLDFLLVDLDEIAREFGCEMPPYGCHEDFTQFVEEICGTSLNHLQMPTSSVEALDMFISLKEIIQNIV